MASPVTIQPSSNDNMLREASSTNNYGTSAQIETNAATGARWRSLLSFDFSALVPAGATITVATLSLYAKDTFTAGRTITVYRLLHTDWVGNQSTWNIYKTGSAWGTAGALDATTDFTSTDAATAASRSTAGWIDWNVKNQVQTALDSVSGVAHFLLADAGAAAAADNVYMSREYTSVLTYRPKLYIEYTVPSAVKPNFMPFFWA